MIKNCLYCDQPFEATTSAKYCPEHRNTVCRKCGSIKDNISRHPCNKCENERAKNYIKRMKAADAAWRPNYSKEQKNKQRKKYYKENPDKIKQYYQRTKGEQKKKAATRYKNNPAAVLARNKKWRIANKDKFKALRKKATDKFRKNNPHIVAWRNILHRVLKQMGINKEKRTIEMCGYSSLQLKAHIESLFAKGMTWENYGKWHIDHIKAVTRFPKDTHVSIVNALSNLQPLWKIDNLRKKNK